MNKRNGINSYLVAFASLAVLVLIVMLLSLRAGATGYEPEPDYMAVMMATAVVGDADCGHQAEELRNDKIDAQGLTYTKVSWDELYLLSKIIYAEAGSDWLSDEWKMSTGEVVLNRVASPEFPNTIAEVINQPGQYYNMSSGYFHKLRPNLRCVGAAKRLLEGERVLNDPSVVFQANFTQGSGTHTALYDKDLGWTYLCFSSKPELYEEAGQ